jgi:hypothetical protein
MGFDQNPLRIADVAGIGLCSHVALYAFPPPYGTGSKVLHAPSSEDVTHSLITYSLQSDGANPSSGSCLGEQNAFSPCLLTSVSLVRVRFGEPFDPQRTSPPRRLTPTAESTAPGGSRFPHFTPLVASRLHSPREYIRASSRVAAARAADELLPQSSQNLLRSHPTG